jgi:putative Mg2+ transporter-C (MgtC) family protein
MISWEELVLRLVVAAVLGGLVGLERERLEWAAGMRTHALVSLGSALFMVVSIFGFSDILNEQHVILDPSRVAAQVASLRCEMPIKAGKPPVGSFHPTA